MARVLVVEDDVVVSRLLASVLRRSGIEPVLCSTGAAAIEALDGAAVDAICLDLVLPDAGGEAILVEIRRRLPEIPVVVLSGQESVARAVEIMKLRPFDYVVKPIDPERFEQSIDAAIRQRELARSVRQLEREVRDVFRFEEIVGHAEPMRRVYEQIDKVLDNRVSVFIHGPSGTGKELIAKAIHFNGSRAAGPFVTLNCGAIAESLQESELFGHEKGAFTGAVALSRGKFEQAHGGTIFLDEVGELSPAVQTRLLRVLQEGTFQRLGGAETLTVDVRVLSATHRDLAGLVEQGHFRTDLYYRLVVFPIDVPPLRDRPGDIPLLVSHFSRKHRELSGGTAAHFKPEALEALCSHAWPGNVRELENVVVRALVSTGGGEIGLDSLPRDLTTPAANIGATPAKAESNNAEILPIAELERQAIAHALAMLDGNVSEAARRLGLGRATMYRKMARYGLTDGSAD